MIALLPLIAETLTRAVHVSAGPDGFVAWIQPPHLAAGLGLVRDHLVAWWEVQR